MSNYFLIYAYASALIILVWIHYSMYYSTDNTILDDLKDIAFMADINPFWIIIAFYFLIAWFGWILLPVKIINRIINIFNKN